MTPRRSFELKRKSTLSALVLLACAALISAQEEGREVFLFLVGASLVMFLFGSIQMSIFCRCPNCGASLVVRGRLPYGCPKCGKPT